MADRELSFKEIQDISFEGLKVLKQICEKNSLTYYLAYGTLLGAVRHGGYIPWDDDIDVLMPRDDYEKLLSMCKKEKTEDWEIFSYKTDPGYCFAWAKMCHKNTIITPSRFNTGFLYGVSVDIFPLDYINAIDLETAREIKNASNTIYKKELSAIKPFSLVQAGFINHLKKAGRFFYYKLIGSKKKSVEEALRKYEDSIVMNADGGEFAAYILDDPIYSREDFESSEENHISFNGVMFRAPANIHNFLKNKYGDYMTLPPKEKQVTHHTYKAYYK